MSGRRRFDADAVIDAAELLFRSEGYDGTSLADVSRATDVGNGSLYAAFGSKHGLFMRVYERYCAGRVALVERCMARVGTLDDAVRRFLDEVVADCTDHRPSWGCLMLNTVAELGRRRPEVVVIASQTTSRMERIVAERVRAEHPQLGEEEAAVLGAQVILASQGLIQASRIVDGPDRLAALADGALAALSGRIALGVAAPR